MGYFLKRERLSKAWQAPPHEAISNGGNEDDTTGSRSFGEVCATVNAVTRLVGCIGSIDYGTMEELAVLHIVQNYLIIYCQRSHAADPSRLGW